MSTQILVSDETLAEVFVETDAELAFQTKVKEQGAMAVEGGYVSDFNLEPPLLLHLSSPRSSSADVNSTNAIE